MPSKNTNARWIYFGPYLPQVEEAAGKHGIGVSKFVQMAVEAFLSAPTIDNSSEDLKVTLERLHDLEKKNVGLRGRISILEQELSSNRLELQDEFAIDPAIVSQIRVGPIQTYKLIEALKLDSKNVKALDYVSEQLEQLEKTGYIRKTNQGWKWL
jgi:hypothetical protein